MNKTLNKIIKELKELQTAERKYLKETGDEAGDHSYLTGIANAIDAVRRHSENQSRADIRQGKNEI